MTLERSSTNKAHGRRRQAPREAGKQEPRVMWRTSGDEARAGRRRGEIPITPLVKAPRVAVQYRGSCSKCPISRLLAVRRCLAQSPRFNEGGSMLKRTTGIVFALMAQAASAQALRPDQAEFRSLYKELVETNTEVTDGSCT